MKIIRIVDSQTGLYVGNETDVVQGKIVLHLDRSKAVVWGYSDNDKTSESLEQIADGLSKAFGFTFITRQENT